jgi:DNA-binding HxlR family transcriptional regulator
LRPVPDMTAFRLQASNCAILPAVELICEKWAFLILRGALNGLVHFEEFQCGLGIARNILSDRLSKLVTGGIMTRDPDSSDGRKLVYSLTPKGEGLLPVVVALRQWGEEWGHGYHQAILVDRRDGCSLRRVSVLSADGRELGVRDLAWAERAEVAAHRALSAVPSLA